MVTKKKRPKMRRKHYARVGVSVYKVRKTGGAFWRLMEYREVRTKRGNHVWRWICIAIGNEKPLKDIAGKLNALSFPH